MSRKKQRLLVINPLGNAKLFLKDKPANNNRFGVKEN